jgi:PAS domain S-box-containing protein
MVEKGSDSHIPDDPAVANESIRVPPREPWLKSDVLQNAILSSAHFSMMATDTNGIMQLFGAGAERMLGYSAGEVVGRLSPVDFHDPQELLLRAREVSRDLSTTIAPDFEALACKASRCGADRYESTLIHKSLKPVPVAISITPLREDSGCIMGYLFVVTDISVRKRGDFEPSEAASPAEQAKLPKSELLARMSHEMRTPLSAILGFAQLMESGTPSPSGSQKRSIGLILQAGWYLEKLIAMTCDLANLESGALSLSLGSIPLMAVMRDCQAMIESQAQMRGVRVIFPRIESPCCVLGDRIRLQQALGNLVSAAIEYSVMGGAVIVECGTNASEWIHIEVNEGGEESSSLRRTRALRPFDTLEQKANAGDGTGIGLLLAKRLVELMGGAIVGESIVGTGKIFSFDLKRVPLPIGAGPTSTRQALGDAAAPTGGWSHNTVPAQDIHADQL